MIECCRAHPKDSTSRYSGRLPHCGISAPSMSALGQERTSPAYLAMSALPPKADKQQTVSIVRFVPKADIRWLFDQLISPTVMPNALAVLRFRNSSTFVACWTGVVLPPPDKRTHAVRQNRRLVEIHLFRQSGHQHRDLGHVLGGHDVIVGASHRSRPWSARAASRTTTAWR